MRQPLFSGSISAHLVVDTSVIINLNATGRAGDVVRAFGVKLRASTVVRDELVADRFSGRNDAELAAALVDAELLEFVELDEQAEDIFASLISGSAADTLDDGEAATLAVGAVSGHTVVIDERKAKRIAAERFAVMEVIATADILCSERVITGLGAKQVGDLIFNSLAGARMFVPERHHARVLDLLGARAMECSSLPSALRQAASALR
jgi:predicted nucleic acid-binding protein